MQQTVRTRPKHICTKGEREAVQSAHACDAWDCFRRGMHRPRTDMSAITHRWRQRGLETCLEANSSSNTSDERTWRPPLSVLIINHQWKRGPFILGLRWKSQSNHRSTLHQCRLSVLQAAASFWVEVHRPLGADVSLKENGRVLLAFSAVFLKPIIFLRLVWARLTQCSYTVTIVTRASKQLLCR